MKRGFNDFSALKALKKELDKKDNSVKSASSQTARRSRTVILKPKEQIEGERLAKERGLIPGCTVSLMDSN